MGEVFRGDENSRAAFDATRVTDSGVDDRAEFPLQFSLLLARANGTCDECCEHLLGVLFEISIGCHVFYAMLGLMMVLC
ncbi:hypothetical protein NSA19_12590, partial [Actinomyces bowdenii]|uniref:hypothetical protein n=1 Tax=Actinomyces bowdenii TaxID=131109 RepID=UPI00214C5C2C